MTLRRTLLILILLIATAAATPPGRPAQHDEGRWPQWRGANMDGLAAEADPPVRWSETENVAWKVELPGSASATPVIRGSRIFVQAAEEDSGGIIRFMVLALERATGAVLWQRTVRSEDPNASIQPNNTWASGSAMVDDDRVYAFFGSRGLYALSHDGDPLWEVDLGELRTRGSFGEGSSAGLHDGTILVNWDQEDDSWLIALDSATGRERWRAARDEPTTWYTPVVAAVGGSRQVVTPGTNAVRGYDLETGSQLWEGPGLTLNAIPSPVIVGEIAYLTAGYRGEALMAVDLAKARGNLAEAGAILWRYDQDTPYVASPLVHEGIVYFIKSTQAILTAVDAATGERVYGPHRLDELNGIYASPVAASGRIYVQGRMGNLAVLRAGRQPEVLAVNRLDDEFDASPVAIGDELYLRGKHRLYRIDTPES